MEKSDEKKEEEFPRLNVSKGGLTGLLQGLMSRPAPTEAWRQQNRKRGGWGGRGFTKSPRSEKRDELNKKRSKIAKASKRNQRTKHKSRISRTGRRK
jgi:hypothetical protein